VREIRIYFEGDSRLTEGFQKFLEQQIAAARERRCRVQLVNGGARSTAIEDFKLALQTHPASWNVLLIDSEGADDGTLLARSGLPPAQRSSVFWMVQLMESWFLADIPALRDFYDQGFREGRLAAKRDLENVPKKDVMTWLENATRRTRKGKYDKAAHAPRLLALIDPELVQKACPNCRRISEAFCERLQESRLRHAATKLEERRRRRG